MAFKMLDSNKAALNKDDIFKFLKRLILYYVETSIIEN